MHSWVSSFTFVNFFLLLLLLLWKKKKMPAGILSGIIPNLIHILTIWKKKAESSPEAPSFYSSLRPEIGTLSCSSLN